MDKISVIVPVYNAENYLDQCINSILNQTYPNVELILVNDGSTDKSYEICQNYANRFNNIRLFNQKNSGLSEARNAGLLNVSGNLIAFVDDDDFVTEDYLKHLFDQMQKYDSDIAITSFNRYIEDSHIFEFMSHSDIMESFNGCYQSVKWDLLRFKFENYFSISMQPWGKLYKRKLWKNVQFPHDRKLAEDDRTTWKLILKANKVSFERYDDYTWRKHNGEASSVYNNELQLYKSYEIQHVYSLEEHIAVLSSIGANISPYMSMYKNWLDIAASHALKYGDSRNYKNFKLRQILLQRKELKSF